MLLIRPARESDAEAITSVHVSAIREVCSACYTPAQIEAWAGSKRPERYLGAIARGNFFVAELGGELRGFACLHTEVAELTGLFVRPDGLRRGIGRRLLAAVESAARSAGLTRVELKSSLNAVPFYQANGFVAGPTDLVLLGPGIELSCTHMHKALE